MVTALYRRYRPETFADLIGQQQVTEPLSAALSSGRINHAYLFSGPRGCGKTTSARILARCLNCAEGPTATPCGVCPSCVELSRDGGGSLDVVEIDAASHNGVDDARDLRERAIFAPARDRYKIFILDEAHMVTSQGFNALLKIVEEPPEHVKFIFATTEPEKVIGTIRSRTHHYPFRLIPQQLMLDYVEKLTAAESITADSGVYALAVRAGGGSARDTLSIVDQLIAGSETDHIAYDRAVALLGYTHAAVLDELIDALADSDAAKAFESVQKAIDNGQDPRRFVEDVLERLRDLIVAAAGGLQESALPGLSDAEQERYRADAKRLGSERLSLLADIVLGSLDQLSGATSPKLQLELMLARMLVALDERERRPVSAAPATVTTPTGSPAQAAAATPPQQSSVRPSAPSAPASSNSQPVAASTPRAEPEPQHSGPVTLEVITQYWPAVLESLQAQKASVWLMVSGITPLAYSEDDVLTLGFLSERDLTAFRQPGQGTAADLLRKTIKQLLGVEVKYRAAQAPAGTRPPQAAPVAPSIPDPTPRPAVSQPAPQPSNPVTTTETSSPAVAQPEPPSAATAEPEQEPIPEEPPAPVDWGSSLGTSTPVESVILAPSVEPVAEPTPSATIDTERYGEPIIRQILGARPIDDDRKS